ncbi:hypothetical protein CMI46_00710 [Candidatus Pacearchaeota archaeon]|nr:hypothetical protein [Candidatus Pacearchaeota archaeon]
MSENNIQEIKSLFLLALIIPKIPIAASVLGIIPKKKIGEISDSMDVHDVSNIKNSSRFK